MPTQLNTEKYCWLVLDSQQEAGSQSNKLLRYLHSPKNKVAERKRKTNKETN